MGADAHAPAKVFDSIVDALLARVANALHGISADSAHAGGLVAGSHVYRVRCVAEVETAGEVTFLERANLMPRWDWEAEARCWHGLRDGLESQGWVAECQGKKRRHGTTE